MTITILVATFLALAVTVRRRRAYKLPDIPGLPAAVQADLATLAKRQRRSWRRRILALRLAGVPLNIALSENWAMLLYPGLRKIFHTRLRGRQELFKRDQIFNMETSSRASEEMQGVGELGTDMFNNFEATGRTSYDDNEPGWKTSLVHREFTGGTSIRRKLIEDSMYPGAELPKSVTDKPRSLADALALHHEKSAASLFNNSFTDTGLDAEGFTLSGADGVGLCSTAHKASPTNAATQSNEGILPLTVANIAATKLLMREFTDDKGNLVSMHPDMLLVPPELEDKAMVINGSEFDPDSAENAINTQRNRWKIVSWDYLTDPTAWWMIDEQLKAEHLVWLTRIAPEFQNGIYDSDTTIARFPAYSRYSRGWDAWQWVYGQNGP